jgi:hypothetical protein
MAFHGKSCTNLKATPVSAAAQPRPQQRSRGRMSAKHFWRMTQGKVMEGVFGECSPVGASIELLLTWASHQQTYRPLLSSGPARPAETLQPLGAVRPVDSTREEQSRPREGQSAKATERPENPGQGWPRRNSRSVGDRCLDHRNWEGHQVAAGLLGVHQGL